MSSQQTGYTQQQRRMMMNSDLLDEYCKRELGHTIWDMAFDESGNYIVTFYNNPMNEEEEDDDD